MKSKPQVLYLSYDGLMEPLGSSQVVSYLEKLSPEFSIRVVSYEKKEDLENKAMMAKMQKRLREEQIKWTALRYHKRPTAPATLYDLARGFFLCLFFYIKSPYQIVHTRSYVVSVIGLYLKRLLPISFLFDIRGFWVEERVESGLWQKGSRLERVAKYFEKQFFLHADHVVSLSQKGRQVIGGFSYLQHRLPPISVIPTCTDLERYTLPPTPPPKPIHVGYVGSVGLWYDFKATALAFKQLQDTLGEDQFKLTVINRDEHAYIRGELQKAGVRSFHLTQSGFEAMPGHLQKFHLGVFFIKPTYSKQASAATKLGEFLASGVPVLINRGIGDSASIVRDENVGVVVDSLEKEDIKEGVEKVLALQNSPTLAKDCRKAAQKYFSLEHGARAYGQIYLHLIQTLGGKKTASNLQFDSFEMGQKTLQPNA